jgi:DNA invertase Pin-like site-specific DNA recombinase
MKEPSGSLPLRAAIYCRISRDKEGAGLGVARQEKDCRALAERLGWEVAAVYVDNDISAASGKPRPQYRAMLEAVQRGDVQGVIAWHTDRLHRRPVELEEFISIAEVSDLHVQTVKAGELDLSTSAGRMVARMLGAAARHEVDNTRDRIKAKKAQAAKAGLYRGGPRPFGYLKGGMRIKESEAEVVREVTSALLAGRSLRAMAAELNDRGVPTPRGKAWTNRALKQVIVRPRIAGMISKGPADRHGMEIVNEEAKWPAIVPKEQFIAVRDLLMQPSRRSSFSTEVSHLGSGLYLCGRCGASLRPGLLPRRARDEDDAPRRFQYRCVENLHLTISEEPTDEHVRGVVAEIVKDPRVVASLGASRDQETSALVAADRKQRDVLAARLDSFERDYAAGAITGAQLAKAAARVQADIQEVETRLAKAVQRAAASPLFAAPDPGAAFLAAPVDLQRSVLSTLVTVKVMPSGPGKKWSSDRISITRVER